MARDLRPGHREAHASEEATRSALTDVPLGFLVRLGGCCSDDVDSELAGDAVKLPLRHEKDGSSTNSPR